MRGSTNHVWFAWARQRVDMLEPLWVAENVEEQGVSEYRQCLGHLYNISVIKLCPTQLGWPIRRRRQFIVGSLRGLNMHVVEMGPLSSINAIIEELFVRTSGFSREAFAIATKEEIEADVAWASGRWPFRYM